MTHQNLQEQIFDIILTRYPSRAEAVAAICELLNLAKDPVYRRLRNETILAPQEIALLARHYKISLDALVNGQSDNVVCSFNAFSRRVLSFSDYLENFIADLSQIRKLPDVHFHYATVEIPVLTYNLFPELISFKLYVWGRTTWNLDFLRNRPFDFDLVSQPVIRLSRELLDHYIALNSTELWSMNIVDNTLAQIEYHVYSGGFRHYNDALILCDKILEWAEHMKQVAVAGKKFRADEKPELGQGNIFLYQNEMVHTNNTALITSNYGKLVYSAFCNPNFILSTDPKLCNYTEEWFRTVIGKSNLISQAAEKNRDGFFQGMTRKVDRIKQRLLTYIQEND